MKIYRLNRIVFSVKTDAEKFLNGLTANALDKPHNAFVNIHGRIVATFDQVKAGEDEFLILIAKGYQDIVLKHLDRYLRLSKTTIEACDYQMFFDVDDSYTLGPGEYGIPQKKGKIVITHSEIGDNSISDEEFALFRLQNNIPLQGIDYHDEFLLNVSDEDFVSFTKGCFLGQEPISKVHSRAKPTWRLVVKSAEECSAEEKNKMTSRTVDEASGETLGFVFVRNTGEE